MQKTRANQQKICCYLITRLDEESADFIGLVYVKLDITRIYRTIMLKQAQVPLNRCIITQFSNYSLTFRSLFFQFKDLFINLCGCMEDADEKLMLRYADGDTTAFEILYTRHKGGLYRYLYRQCGNSAIAEELYQDIWLNLIRARERYTVQAKFTTYLYRLAHNKLIDYYRKQSKGVPASFDDDDCPDQESIPDLKAENPTEIIDKEEKKERLKKSIALLPEAQREAFLLREESGLKLAEIANVTGVNVETAKSRLRYAVSKLKVALRGEP